MTTGDGDVEFVNLKRLKEAYFSGMRENRKLEELARVVDELRAEQQRVQAWMQAMERQAVPQVQKPEIKLKTRLEGPLGLRLGSFNE